MRYAFITQHKKPWPIDPMCRVLGVTRNGYYSYCKRRSTMQPDPDHQDMLDAVKAVAQASGDTYGSRPMKHALNALGYPVGRWKARRLMRESGIFARCWKKYKVTTNSNHKQPVFENVLERQFSVSGPDQAYVSDITYIWTQEGWLYLAVVIDLFSRRVVGWSMSSRRKAKLVTDTLRMAIWQRRPPGLIVHSDQGWSKSLVRQMSAERHTSQDSEMPTQTKLKPAIIKADSVGSGRRPDIGHAAEGSQNLVGGV